jgi:hypothetical protein
MTYTQLLCQIITLLQEYKESVEEENKKQLEIQKTREKEMADPFLCYTIGCKNRKPTKF